MTHQTCHLYSAAVATLLLVATAASPAHGGCVAIMSQSYVNTLNRSSGTNQYKTNNPLPANITTKAQCEDYLRSFWNYGNDAGYRDTKCECGDSAGSGGSGITIPSGATPGQVLALSIIGAALAPPAGPSPEELARKQAQEDAARAVAEEKARQQAEKERQQQEADRIRRQKLASQMKGVDQDMTPPTAASAITPGSGTNAAAISTFDRLRCAQALSDASAQYASLGGREAAEKARFYADQARKALAGERLEIACPAAGPLPAVPEPTGIERVHLGEDTLPELMQKAKVDLASLNQVQVKQRELSERKARVATKQQEAKEKLTNPPEVTSEDQSTDSLKAEAEALLRESEAELAEIEQDEKSLDKEQARLADNLERYETKARTLEASNAGNRAR